jgi:uncharacterized membrane protein
MEHFEGTIVINRPIEEVFKKATDIANHVHWTTGLEEARLTSPGPILAGSTYVYKTVMMGFRLDTVGEVVEYQSPFIYKWKSIKGPFPLSGGINFKAVPEGTLVTQYTDADPGGFFKLASSVLFSNAQKQVDENLRRMKDWMEKG